MGEEEWGVIVGIVNVHLQTTQMPRIDGETVLEASLGLLPLLAVLDGKKGIIVRYLI